MLKGSVIATLAIGSFTRETRRKGMVMRRSVLVPLIMALVLLLVNSAPASGRLPGAADVKGDMYFRGSVRQAAPAMPGVPGATVQLWL